MLIHSWNLSSDKINGEEYLNKELLTFSDSFLTSCSTFISHNFYDYSLNSAEIIFKKDGSLINKGNQSSKSFDYDSSYISCTAQYFIGYNSFKSNWTWQLSADEKTIILTGPPFYWNGGGVTYNIYKFKIEEINYSKIILKGTFTNIGYFHLKYLDSVTEELTLTR